MSSGVRSATPPRPDRIVKSGNTGWQGRHDYDNDNDCDNDAQDSEMIPATDDGTVLVIDDEPDNLRLALEMLRGQGLEMVSARDGAAGVHIATRLRPDLILLDIRMPGLDGFEVCGLLKANPVTREIPVIFLTALDQIEDKARGFALGGVDYVTKPFDARELLLRVASHLRLARRVARLPERCHTPAPNQRRHRWTTVRLSTLTAMAARPATPDDERPA